MASITKINKIKTNTSNQYRTTIPKEFIKKFKLKKSDQIIWKKKGKTISLTFIKNES